jgi:P pilus assembly chaperone PapD
MHIFNYAFFENNRASPYYLSLSNLILTTKGKESVARKEYPPFTKVFSKWPSLKTEERWKGGGKQLPFQASR